MRVTFAPDQVSQCFVHRILANRMITAWKVSKYGVFSGPYFPAFGLIPERYYSVRMREKVDQKKLRNWTLFTQGDV